MNEDIIWEVQQTAEKEKERIEKEMKEILGDLWDKYKDEAYEWLQLVAEMQWRIATNETPLTLEITKKHIEMGKKCFLRRVHCDLEKNTYNFIENVLNSILNKALVWGAKIGKEFLESEIEKIDLI
jgi:hypothetical protein